MSVEAAPFLDKNQAIKLSVGSSQLPPSALHPALGSCLAAGWVRASLGRWTHSLELLRDADGRRLQSLGSSSFLRDTAARGGCCLTGKELHCRTLSLPSSFLPPPPACGEKGRAPWLCYRPGGKAGTQLQLRKALISGFLNMGAADFFLSYIKGAWKPHWICLHFKMSGWGTASCAVLRLLFSLKLKASICCHLPQLKLAPPLKHCHWTQGPAKAGDRPALGWDVVNLFHITKGKVSSSQIPQIWYCCLSQSCSLTCTSGLPGVWSWQF